ncbi:hypothetical protein KJ840_02395 [Patescibacteria group bacterium]|nr:hypothetical protein [Patescibacteria group bacterium]
MDIKNIILIAVALINIFLGVTLLVKNAKSPINVSFSLVTFGVAVWSFGIAMFNKTLDMETAIAWARLYYFGGAIIIFAFLFFANHFPYKSFAVSENKLLLITLPLLTITFVIFHPTLLVEKATHYFWGNDANVKLLGHVLYIIYFFSFLILAYKMLITKFKKSEGVIRFILLQLIIITAISFIIAFTFDLIVPLLGNYRLIWVGPYFSLITIFYVMSLIFKKLKRGG